MFEFEIFTTLEINTSSMNLKLKMGYKYSASSGQSLYLQYQDPSATVTLTPFLTYFFETLFPNDDFTTLVTFISSVMLHIGIELSLYQ